MFHLEPTPGLSNPWPAAQRCVCPMSVAKHKSINFLKTLRFIYKYRDIKNTNLFKQSGIIYLFKKICIFY